MNVNVYLRSAKSDDASRIASILIDARKTFLPFAQSPHSEEEIHAWVQEYLIPTNGVTVATNDDKIIGVQAVSRLDGITWLDQFYLDPEYVGRGIGSKMLAQLLQTVPRPIRLYTFQQNQPGRYFYERHGFQAIQFRDGKHNEEHCPDVLYEYTAD